MDPEYEALMNAVQAAYKKRRDKWYLTTHKPPAVHLHVSAEIADLIRRNGSPFDVAHGPNTFIWMGMSIRVTRKPPPRGWRMWLRPSDLNGQAA